MDTYGKRGDMGLYQLRGYQINLINKITKSMKTGHHKIIVQSPPSDGKNGGYG